MPLRALARVNLAAIERNVARLERELRGTGALCAVVKADGYGHGAVPSARAALAGGASWLAVATAAEAAQLRAGGVDTPILVMGALSREELRVALAARADVVAWTEPFVGELAVAARDGAAISDGPEERIRVHVKLDTGMGRLGTRELDEALGVATRVLEATPALELAGAMTHFATADENDAFVREQLERFGPFAAEMRTLQPGIVVHAANSAATLCVAESHLDMVRCGIAIYGCDPLHEDPSLRGLEPALELTSYLAAVKRAAPGDSAGYGRRFVAERETWIGTLPIGYGDGIRRDLTNNCDVLVGGVRYPLVGMVSMDNITIDLGPTPDVRTGEIATIIGRSGEERQTVEELADRLGTINYEVLCGISARVPRVYHHDGEPL
jgi:alanine racemase